MTKYTNFRIYGFAREKDGKVWLLLKDHIGRYPLMADRYRLTVANEYNLYGMQKTRKISKKEAQQLVDDIAHNNAAKHFEITIEDIHQFILKHRKKKHENKTS